LVKKQWFLPTEKYLILNFFAPELIETKLLSNGNLVVIIHILYSGNFGL